MGTPAAEAFAEFQRETKAAERRRDRQLKTLQDHYKKRQEKIEREFYSRRRAAFEKMQASGGPV